MKTSDEYELCPICESEMLKYDESIGMNRCYNNDCKWIEEILPAPSMNDAIYAVEKAKNKRHKEFLEKVLEVTKKVIKEGREKTNSFDIIEYNSRYR